MLETLRIKNIAIIDTAEIGFKKGLNILSGETGAGKSIVIEAISLLLGSRANAELIRSGCDEAVIEGIFNISEIPWMRERLARAGFDDDTSELLIKRTVHRGGRHRISVNGELANLSVLQNICEGLIDLCGQHEHQSLLKSTTQMDLLDRYGGLNEQVKKFSTVWNQFQNLKCERNKLEIAESDRLRKVDFLKFQADEIKNAALEIGEDECLLAEKQLLQSAAGRIQAAEGVRQILECEGEGVLELLRAALLKVRSLSHLDPKTEPMVDSLERAAAEVEEVSLGLHRYLGSVEMDPERLQIVQDRLSLIGDLRRKYGSSIEEVLSTFSQLERELVSLEQVEGRLNAILNEINEVESILKKLGKKLSQARSKVAGLLGLSVTGELKDLKMGEAKFGVELSPQEELSDWNSSGGDLIQFVVQTNCGEPARPIGKIASGGELSRLMLAIRRVISDRGGIGVYLFDEIDSGIGGQTAFQVGKKLKSVAAYNQVICITHLPQVASFADCHWVVRKSVNANRTVTEVVELSPQRRKEELARMLGGPQLTHKSLENASELLELAKS